MISSRPVLSRDARFCATAARVYTHLASLPWLVWLLPPWTNLDNMLACILLLEPPVQAIRPTLYHSPTLPLTYLRRQPLDHEMAPLFKRLV